MYISVSASKLLFVLRMDQCYVYCILLHRPHMLLKCWILLSLHLCLMYVVQKISLKCHRLQIQMVKQLKKIYF